MLKKQPSRGCGAPKPETALSKMIEEAEGPVDLEPFFGHSAYTAHDDYGG